MERRGEEIGFRNHGVLLISRQWWEGGKSYFQSGLDRDGRD